jgi:hypothetical protein
MWQHAAAQQHASAELVVPRLLDNRTCGCEAHNSCESANTATSITLIVEHVATAYSDSVFELVQLGVAEQQGSRQV